MNGRRRDNTRCLMGSARVLSRGLLASSLVTGGRHRLPTLPRRPPRLHSPFLRYLPVSVHSSYRRRSRTVQERTKGGRRVMVGSSGLSLGDGWFYPNAINSPAPRAHASRVRPTLVPRAPLAMGIAMLPLDLARRCIPLLRVLESAGRNHFVPQNRWQPWVAGISVTSLHSWILDKNRMKKLESRQRRRARTCLQGWDLITVVVKKKVYLFHSYVYYYP